MPHNTTGKALPFPATTSHRDSLSPHIVFYRDNTAAVAFYNERLIAQRYGPQGPGDRRENHQDALPLSQRDHRVVQSDGNRA